MIFFNYVIRTGVSGSGKSSRPYADSGHSNSVVTDRLGLRQYKVSESGDRGFFGSFKDIEVVTTIGYST